MDFLEHVVEIIPMAVLYEQLTCRVPVEHIGGNWYVADGCWLIAAVHPPLSAICQLLEYPPSRPGPTAPAPSQPMCRPERRPAPGTGRSPRPAPGAVLGAGTPPERGDRPRPGQRPCPRSPRRDRGRACGGVRRARGLGAKAARRRVVLSTTARARGWAKREAVPPAGQVRLRPILMPTATTVLGVLPMALGLGEGAEIRTPMAITVIAGLISGTALTLIIIPSIYHLVARGD